MGNNYFDGILPKSLGNLSTSVEIFYARHCGIKGIIPNEIGNLSNLIKLDIGDNKLTGRIPDILGQLRKLQRLILRVNKLQGPVFANLGDLVHLYYLDLGNNKLSQQFPKCLAPEIGNIKSMRGLYLSGNQFSGDIPSTIGQLQNLENLTLSNNRLHGPIPESFGNLISLKILDLSKNKLNGVIPKSLEKLQYLEYFNVSFNDLTGEIPNGGPFKNFMSEFFMGNRELCEGSQFKVKPCKFYLIRHHRRNTLLPSQSTPPITVKRISYYEVLNATNKFGEENLIGKGSIGSVYKGIFSDGMIAAIKIFNLGLEDVASALEYLHYGYPSPIVHCDLKPSNILLDENMVAHVADFSIAKLFIEDQRISITKMLGTIEYKAPEYGSTGLVSTMVDVYSYGIMLMETFTKKKLTDNMFVGEFTMRKWVLESFPDAIMHVVDVDLVNAAEDNIQVKESCFKLIMGLALQCTIDLPKERLIAKDVLTRLKKTKT
ncbi:putative receptor-like protein kinase At3g47110 [Olea europaea var. sylvestris]|uniref:putative receptor-like protein kinase At3g47110 n=1 Tax=Olea europaea var. sylvestris TaxID=158386 RepID=UPI000C1D4230|nr:putative receptor-like protein kinase At3g47110 [Olea europaea var. sylvestris]